MADPASIAVAPQSIAPLRLLAEQAFSRAAGAPLIPGNDVRLLKDAEENYPAWLEAIHGAKKSVDFETYFIRPDKIGYEFASLLESKARQGLRVRLVYDWFGARSGLSLRFWRALRKAGVKIKSFNPPRLDDPFDSFRRDHRKTIVVDGCIGFASGLCVGNHWIGNPARGVDPWRDTGVKIEGPAVADLSRAFNRIWNLLSPSSTAAENHEEIPAPAGDISLRIVPSEPSMAGLYRLDLLIAALARKSIWLTDAYFLGTPSYVQSLRAAAFDGVDVRLLLPRTSDIPIVRAMSRVGYRTLLEAGVRIFEWNGSMLHAKTGVADDRWSRVGSTNLNLASWMSNYELDVVVENESFAADMADMYLDDLDHSTEIVLSENSKVRPVERRKRQDRPRGSRRASVGRAATGVIAMGKAVGAAVATPRLLGPAEAPLMLIVAGVLLAIAALAIFFPSAISRVVAILCAWIAATLLLKALRLRFPKKK